MDRCDYDVLGSAALKGVGRETKKSIHGDHTLRDFAMQPPEKVTRHAARRKKERGRNGPLVARHAAGTYKSVVTTYVHQPHDMKLKLVVNPGKLIGHKGARIQALQDQSSTRMRVYHGMVYLRGTKAACKRAKKLLVDQGIVTT